MPEGDSIHFAARRIRAALAGGALDHVETPSRRTTGLGWVEQLRGRAVERVEARGKHLLIWFADELVLHSHLRMTGKWTVRRAGDDAAGRRAPWRAWLVMRRGEWEAVEFDGPLLELRTPAQVRADPRIRRLGPDLCAPEDVDRDRVLRRLRQDDPTRPIGDALLDQRIVAGIGNVWKSEACHAVELDPWRPTGEVSDAECLAAIDWVTPGIRRCARLGTHLRPREVYGQRGRPCPRCGTTIEGRGMGDDNRTTFWCPGCQR